MSPTTTTSSQTVGTEVGGVKVWVTEDDIQSLTEGENKPRGSVIHCKIC